MSSKFDFSELSSKWFELDGPMKMLHRMNDARIKLVTRYVAKHHHGLDVGSGAGIFPIAFTKKGYSCDALEKKEELIKVGKLRAQSQDVALSWHQSDLLGFKGELQYDYLTCFEVIEHIEDRAAFLEKVQSLVKPGGYIFFSTLNRTLASYLTTVLGAEYILKLLPIGTHDYRLFIKPQELSNLLDKSSVIDLHGLIYNPFTRSFFLGSSTSANYIGVWQKDQSSIS